MSAIRSLRVMVPVVALSLLAWAQAPARAEDTVAAKGTISGKVVEASGTPAANAAVRLLPAKQHKKKEAEPGADKSEKKMKREAVAETTTDKNGAFTLADVPAGEYVVAASEKGEAGREKVEVTAGKTADVTITLKVVEKGDKKKNAL